ncbi:MAG TPA: ribonuclease P protein component [Acidocella sp.]|jgi:ribonuclease P protein component|uniref:ribonuclease P protein component n=1 Tax=Acidocella sp. TaxID=50710 RepID=UPI002CAC2B3D|nr:ribonuclease P protein component [Acidocella sp.]HVE21763.1 ribonuclease P protein component [Acidocella sp.]
MAARTPPETFRCRAEFLRLAARGRKLSRPGFLMQALAQPGEAPVRVGYTATKKIGNAVLRNRARRRLREAVRLTFAERPIYGVELVLVCRKETATLPFATLRAGLESALAELRT